MKSIALFITSIIIGASSWMSVTPDSAPAIFLDQNSGFVADLITNDYFDLPTPNFPTNMPGTCFSADDLTIFKVGGRVDTGTTSTPSTKVESLTNGVWTNLPGLLVARSDPAVVFTGGRLYSIGGNEDSIYGVYCAYFDGTSWHTFSGIKTYKHGSGPYAKQYYLAQHGRVAIPLSNGNILVAGGETDGTRTDILNTTTLTWSVGPDLPEPISYGAVVNGNIIYNPATNNFFSFTL